MLHGIARLAIAAPRRIIAVALLVMVGAGIFGIPVTKSLSAGGFQDPTSESWQAARLLSEKFDQGDMPMVIARHLRRRRRKVHAARAVGADLVRQLQASPHVADVNSAWTAPPPAAPALISKDGKTGLIVAGITGGENGAQKHAKAAGRSAGVRPRRRHRARGWRGDDLRRRSTAKAKKTCCSWNPSRSR